MTGRKLLTLAFMLVSVIVVRANGDPVAVHSAITLSPTPVAVHVPEVQLVDEVVCFTPRGRYMDVTVRYLLHNRSGRSFDSLPYGFPIDYWGQGEAHWEDIDEIFESQMEKGWRDSYIRNVSFTLGDRQLKWQCSKDTLLLPPQPYISEAWFDTSSEEGRREFDSLYAIYGDSVYSYTHEISRRWYYTYLDIPADSYVTLEVRYSVECNLTQGLYAMRDYLTDDEWYQRFQYDFTPASYWGDGHADRFNVQLDVSKIRPIEGHGWLKDIGDWSDSLVGLPMQHGEDYWTYSATRFDLAAAKPFVLAYRLKGPMPQPIDKLLSHRLSPDQYTITVSGADKKYPVGNLSDLDLATATVLRPDKEDSLYITIRFKKPTRVDAMLLVNGYTKNTDTWRNNARIDSLMVHDSIPYALYRDYDTDKIDTVINRKGWDEQMLFGEADWIVKWTDFRPLPAKYPHGEPAAFDFQSIIDNALIITTNNRYSYNLVTEIKIRITAVDKGLKYDDLCISEIILLK
ncbi:MAG: hypothetical protein IK010_04470 [Bacteroidales bacterium]|nr:hypothetical protein [Bacteroidales bacterium]